MAIAVQPPRRLSRTYAFWLVAAAMLTMLVAASAPSPLYVVYQARLGFSATLLTVIFAVYAVALLTALLVVGSLSDHVGRRPVLAAAFALEVVSMLVFLSADGVPALLAARIAQGLATGAATGTLSAALIDLQPERPAGLGPLVNTVAPLAGLAAGAFGSGLLVQYAPAPTTIVFALLAAAFAVLTAAFWLVPETAPRHPGWRASLVPRAGVPRPARRTFAAALPALLAAWAIGGLYLSLGASLTAEVLHTPSHVVGGLVVAFLAGAGVASTLVLRNRAPHQIAGYGTTVLAVGTAVTLTALVAGSLPGFLLGTAVAGSGFGASFLGVLRSMAAVSGPGERAKLFATVYVVSYLAFGIPAVVAGVLATTVGLRDTALGYGAVVIVLAVVAAIAVPRSLEACPQASSSRSSPRSSGSRCSPPCTGGATAGSVRP